MLHHGPPLHRAVLDGVEQVHGEADAERGRGDRGDVSPRPRHPEALVSQGIGRVVVVPELADRPVLVPCDLVLVRGHLLGLALLLLADLLLLVELLQLVQDVFEFFPAEGIKVYLSGKKLNFFLNHFIRWKI